MVAVTSPISRVVSQVDGTVTTTAAEIARPTTTAQRPLQWTVALTNTHATGNLFIVLVNDGDILAPTYPSTSLFSWKIAPGSTLTLDIAGSIRIFAIADTVDTSYNLATFAR